MKVTYRMMLQGMIAGWMLLGAVSGVRAQLVFDLDRHDFGSIREADGAVTCTFTGVNRGTKPIVLLDVVTSCGCTVPEYSRKPVLPGASTRIVVTYDPANRPGRFSKELAVYASDKRKIATLTIGGTVIPRPKSIEELYPVYAGGGVRLSTTLSSFSYLYVGKEVHAAVEYVNTSKHAVEFRLRPKETSGCLRIGAPERIEAGERGSIDLAYVIPASNPHYGTVKDAFEVVVSGRSRETVLVAHGIVVDDPALRRGKPVPVLRTSENIVRFGEVDHATTVERRTFVLANDGDGELIVRAVETGGRIGTSLRAGTRIAPHDSLTVEVTIRPSDADYGPLLDRLAIITNDPARPMRRLRVTAVVVSY